MISIIIPVYNERENIEPLIKEVSRAADSLNKQYEIIIVDDGSKDGTFDALKREISGNDKIKIIQFNRNFGQTAAFAAGIEHASGDIIVTSDGDLENDPNDIPRLLSMLDSGYDLVSGWRKDRWKGSALSRKIPSKIANALISWISGVPLHDYGCMLKAYRKDVIADVVLYGEMHRFIPAFVHKNGAKIAEIEVNYRPRRFGKSKYGLSRTFRVILDLMFLKFFLRYLSRPIHFFGGIGLVSLFLGGVAGVAAVMLKIIGLRTFVSTPLPVFSALFIIVGVQLIVMGILAELLMRIYYESGHKTPYKIKEKINITSPKRALPVK